jgi:hypothetical protein
MELTRAAARDLRDSIELTSLVAGKGGAANASPTSTPKPEYPAALPRVNARDAEQWAAEYLRGHPYTNLRDLEEAAKVAGQRYSHETLRKCPSVRAAMDKAGTRKEAAPKAVSLTDKVIGHVIDPSPAGADPAEKAEEADLLKALATLSPDARDQIERMPHADRAETLDLLLKQQREQREDQRTRSPREGRRRLA